MYCELNEEKGKNMQAELMLAGELAKKLQIEMLLAAQQGCDRRLQMELWNVQKREFY